MKSINLYDYQEKCLQELSNGWKTGHKNQLLYGPCSFGKTEVALEIMRRAAENGWRSAMIMDRRILVNQTSDRADSYNIDHGVYMAQHWRYLTYKSIQLCSAQTMEAKGEMPANIRILIYDECHVNRKFITEYIKNNPKVFCIGLTGSPFTKGLGAIYSRVVSTVTIKELINDHGKLTPVRVFISKEIDMGGVQKTAGEWQPGETGKRGVKIVGDVVSTWVEKTYDLYGEPKKTIVFVPDVATGQLYEKRFNEAGYNFKSISYKDTDNDLVIEEFCKPDSKYIGLIATDILTKGFSVDDVYIGISARPFSKSFSSHVQQFGRIQRTYEGKNFAVWIDHSGNYLRFLDQWDDLYHNGVSELDDGAEKPKPEPTKEQKEAAKCHKCGQVWGPTDVCQSCGAIRIRKSTVEEIAGKVEEFGDAPKKKEKFTMADKELWYAQLLGYAKQKRYNDGWASHKYREKFNVWPSRKDGITPIQPSGEVIKFIQHLNIKSAKSNRV